MLCHVKKYIFFSISCQQKEKSRELSWVKLCFREMLEAFSWQICVIATNMKQVGEKTQLLAEQTVKHLFPQLFQICHVSNLRSH